MSRAFDTYMGFQVARDLDHVTSTEQGSLGETQPTKYITNVSTSDFLQHSHFHSIFI